MTLLNDLGIVLHFEEVKAYEYYVLDPYWITYGVYQILTSVNAGKNKGVVSMEDLEFIVNVEEDKKRSYCPSNYKKIQYTNNQRRFLVDVLNQFKLCFYLADRSQFIIPDLLDTNEPIEITGPIRKAEDNIRFVYEYDYLPGSTMPNVMVETHRIHLKMWRTGCVLQNDGCKALVSNYENRITIIVSGEHKRKRDFMSVIRYVIDSINQKQSDKPRMLIPLPGIDDYADYEKLLALEKDKEKNYFHYNKYKHANDKFIISELLEGIPSQDELREMSNDVKMVLANQKIIIENQEEIKSKLDFHFEYLINLNENSKIKDELLSDIQRMDKNNLKR